MATSSKLDLYTSSSDKGLFKGIRRRLNKRKRQRELPQRLREWLAAVSMPDDDQLYSSLSNEARNLADWLAGLSDAENVTFSHDVEAFCSSMNFDIAWLLDGKLARMPELRQSLQEAIELYCLARHKARRVNDDIKAFVAFENWKKEPTAADQKEFSQELFASLVNNNLASEPSTDLFLASEDQRQRHAADVILQVAENNTQEFNQVLKNVIVPGSAIPEITTPTSASKKRSPSRKTTKAQSGDEPSPSK